jgi:hypothetical protein
MYFLPRHKPPTRHSGTVNVLNSAVCVFVHVIAMGLATLTHTSKPSDYYHHIHLRAYIFFFPTLPSQAVTTAHPKRAILDGPCIRIQELSSTT